MARDENPPFERGQTYFDQDQTISATNVTDSNYLLGKEWTFEDRDLTDQTTHLLRSGNYNRCRLVRNISGISLLPKRLVTFSDPATSGYTVFGCEVDGYADTTAEKSYPVDEWLPSTGVRDDDLFWIVVKGPATVLTNLAQAATGEFTVNSLVVALTAATSGATSAGRAVLADFTGATALLAAQIYNRLGRAMSAKTSGNTNADLLVFVGEF